jgi:hypothetical protein
MGDFANRFGDIVRGLVSLEVNTIVKEGMSATRMGAPLVALSEIAARYAKWLQKNGSQCEDPPDPVTPAYLSALVTEARAVKVAHPGAEGVAVMATRIERSSSHLKAIFDKITGPDPEPDEIVQLRKVWEIGTEEVVMQTVFWIDGDAVQRVHPAYADGAHERLLAVHSAGVGVALSYWRSLGELLVSLFNSAWKELSSR